MGVPTHLRATRLGRRRADMKLIQQASRSITELSASLDRQLAAEDRPAERMRMLRETTNRVTRTANDAIQAYGRVRSALSSEIERPEGDRDGAREMQRHLSDARAEVLRALDAMKQRYAWGYAPDAGEREEPERPAESDRPAGPDPNRA